MKESDFTTYLLYKWCRRGTVELSGITFMTYEEQQRKIVEMTLLNKKPDKSEPCNLAFGIGE